jgi:hypothetical protein
VHQQPKAIYWHRELPPADAEAIGEHTLDANSHRVPDTIAHRDELWTAVPLDRLATIPERPDAGRLRQDGVVTKT